MPKVIAVTHQRLMTRPTCLSAVPLLVATLVGCSSGDDSRPPPLEVASSGTGGRTTIGGGSQNQGGAPSVADIPEDYPAGPYGEGNPGEGETLENLSLRGFVNYTNEGLASDQPFVDFDFATLRQSGPQYVLIHVGAFWCSSCRTAAEDLAARSQQVIDAGGGIVELVIDGSSPGENAKQSHLEFWIESAGLGVTTVGPVDDRAREIFPEREFAYIVDLATMEVVWRGEGLYATPTITTQAVDEMLSNWL